MRLCQLMFIGEIELAGDLLEVAHLMVSKPVRYNNAGNFPTAGLAFFSRR